MMHDPVRRNCATCVWWERQGPQIATALRDPTCPRDTGICQRHSPIVAQPVDGIAAPLFPRTHETRFCGDWQGQPHGSGPDGGERIASAVTPIRRQAA